MTKAEVLKRIRKSWGVGDIGCPFGSVDEHFANEKMLDIAISKQFPEEVVDLIRLHPIRFPSYQKWDNGKSVGEHFMDVVERYYNVE